MLTGAGIFENTLTGAGAGGKRQIPALTGAGAGIPVDPCTLCLHNNFTVLTILYTEGYFLLALLKFLS